jgi:hypothetical protein
VENELNQLSDTVNALGNQTSYVTGQTAGNYTKFWGVTKSVGGIEDYVSFQDSSLLSNNANETLAQFFGITNIYVGGQQRLINKKQSELTAADGIAPDCPVCPVVAAVECPTLPEHIILTVTGKLKKKEKTKLICNFLLFRLQEIFIFTLDIILDVLYVQRARVSVLPWVRARWLPSLLVAQFSFCFPAGAEVAVEKVSAVT